MNRLIAIYCALIGAWLSACLDYADVGARRSSTSRGETNAASRRELATRATHRVSDRITTAASPAAQPASAARADKVDVASPAADISSERARLRGLLASDPFDAEPMKSVYFFPGEGAAGNRALYTVHPSSEADLRWNSDVQTRGEVLDHIIATHANTLIMSYWGDEMAHWSPMQLDETSVRGVIEAAVGKPLLIVPSLESGIDPEDPSLPHWRFSEDFPYAGGVFAPDRLAPSLLERLHTLCALFSDHLETWAELYDRTGRPRHVVHVVDAYAQTLPVLEGTPPERVIAEAFDLIAEEIYATEGIEIGFTLDVSAGGDEQRGFHPERLGAALEGARSVLAIQFFMSESRSGRVLSSAPWAPPIDNNTTNLEALLDGKLTLLRSWRRTGIPVIYDMSSGFDGRVVWAVYGSGFWGDNANYTFDAWRNYQSEHKSSEFVGLTFNTWNGYTEGYAAVPTLEHGTTIYDWLTDLYATDPRACDHVAYADGRRSYRVSGAICEKWRALGGSRGALGAPQSDEVETPRGRASHFAFGSIFSGDATGTHEVHGAIAREYARVGYDAGCLGLPVADEESTPDGRISRFERGIITFRAGDLRAHAHCHHHASPFE